MTSAVTSPDRARPGDARPGPRDVGLAVGVLVLDLLVFFDPSAPGTVVPVVLVPVLAVAVCVPLVWRRARPLAVFTVVWASSTAVLLLVPGYRPLVALWVALYVVAAQRRRAEVVAALVAAAAPATLAVGREAAQAAPGQRTETLVVTVTLLVVVLAVVVAAGRYRGSSQRQIGDLERRREAAAREAVADERARIARELHDSVAHAVGLMSLQASGAARVLRQDPDRAERALDQVGRLGEQAVAELHRMLGMLHVDATGTSSARGVGPGHLEDGVGPAITALVTEVRAAGVPVTLTLDGVPEPGDPSAARAAYRIVQESLTNAVKHGSRQAPVDVTSRWSADRLEVVVVNAVPDAPTGGPRLSTGHGLPGLAERARAVGGELDAGSVGAGRWQVRAVLPWRPAAPTPVAVTPGSSLAPDPLRVPDPGSAPAKSRHG